MKDVEGEFIAREKIEHKEKKGSTLMWFVIGIIPIVNFYLLWKIAESISGHEKAVKRYEFLVHRKTKGSTTLWFIPFLVPFIVIPFLVGLAFAVYYVTSISGYYGIPGPTLGGYGILGIGIIGIVLLLAAIVVGIYILWKMAEIVSGHEKIYKKYEILVHKEKKDSNIKWFVIGIIPILNLYLYWKVAEVVSGHEKIYA